MTPRRMILMLFLLLKKDKGNCPVSLFSSHPGIAQPAGSKFGMPPMTLLHLNW